ncbi:hypothetical protein M438DRAFT_351483 [Aureobasidium pullulans EXF-150]|uniref:Uncharacterized protein n=1 Tax=Aureobasidium pullulans EXF-150 TaxID=1043002 RepID=A0A074XRF5_AURPU|nr:uncharacterized protein M438DRAFT_351483 [Aureobasidium pullulans EXF-150]KEQ88183.1 hypothetical protein M438DRAFT_351483 [Aureobasidium pullulans EXF-150]
MDIVSPIAAAIAIAANAATAGFALKKLCRGCATAEREIGDASQRLSGHKLEFKQWDDSWRWQLEQCQQKRDAKLGYLDIWGKDALNAVKGNSLAILGYLEDVQHRMESCISPDKTRKTKPRSKRRIKRKVSVFKKLIFYVYGIQISKRSSTPKLPSDRSDARIGWLRKIKWCTSISQEVDDFLAKIDSAQRLIQRIASRAFDSYRRNRSHPGPRVSMVTLTVSKAFRQFRREIRSDQRLSIIGHALVRDREGLEKIRDDRRSSSEAPIKLVFLALPEDFVRQDRPTVMLANVYLDINTRNTGDEEVYIRISSLGRYQTEPAEKQSLVETITKDHNIDAHESLLKKVQMARTICTNVFDLYESGCLPVNLSIADIYTYQHALLLSSERSKVGYRDQMYVRASHSGLGSPSPTPFDHMHERYPFARDILLHRLGIVLFEIGHESEYQDVLPLPESPVGSPEDQLRKHVDTINRSIQEIGVDPRYRALVRSCLSGSLGQDVVDAAESSFAREVIAKLETIEVGIAKAIERRNQ